MEMDGSNILMQKYELGQLLGQGTFGKVHRARNLKTGQHAAIKVINKEKAIQVGLINQIKREISIMRLVRHPNVIQLYEVMASRSKIYFAMEYAKGGELFAKVAKGRLKEDAARTFFQQLIAAVDFCHSRGVYHRDLKPENLLVDEFGNLKISDFGLSALIDSKRQDGLLHTTCGTPAYAAPEVINDRGYDGEKADIWSCGVILYVLLAGFLPFNDPNLLQMYVAIKKGEFECPTWFPPEVKKLLRDILDPNPETRITLSRIMENPWFRKSLESNSKIVMNNEETTRRSVLDAVEFNLDSKSDSSAKEQGEFEFQASCSTKLSSLNAFDLISRLPGSDLSGLFDNDGRNAKRHQAWFTTQVPPEKVVLKLEEVAGERFKITKQAGVVKMEGCKRGRKGQLVMEAKIFEVKPGLYMVELKKTTGDTMEYLKFRDQELSPSLKDEVWSWLGSSDSSSSQAPGERDNPVRGEQRSHWWIW